MKKIKIILAIFTAVLISCAIYACSSDDAQQSQTKAQILLKKSKELAKKYNVDLHLKAENIDKIAETLTVEQMEKDYQSFAKSCDRVVQFSTPKSATTAKTRNRISIRRKMQGVEYMSDGKVCFLCDTPQSAYTEVISGYFELQLVNGSGFLYMSSGATSCQGNFQEKYGGYFNDEKDYRFYISGPVYWDSPYYSGTVYASGEFRSDTGNYVSFSRKYIKDPDEF